MRQAWRALGWLALAAAVVIGCTQAKKNPRSAELKVGSPAPELSGVDLDRQPLALSDYRGKVVLLSFWGVS